MTRTTLREIREVLATHAFLFDDPTAYLAGVDDALDRVPLADVTMLPVGALAGAPALLRA